MSIDICDEMNVQFFYMERTHCLTDHSRPYVGTAYSDIDDIGYRLAGETLPFPGVNLLRETAHLVKNGLNVGNDIFSIDQNFLVTGSP